MKHDLAVKRENNEADYARSRFMAGCHTRERERESRLLISERKPEVVGCSGANSPAAVVPEQPPVTDGNEGGQDCNDARDGAVELCGQHALAGLSIESNGATSRRRVLVRFVIVVVVSAAAARWARSNAINHFELNKHCSICLRASAGPGLDWPKSAA